jgi:hypothetical protein
MMALLGTTAPAQAQVTTARVFFGNNDDTPTSQLYSFTSAREVGNRYGASSKEYGYATSFYRGASNPPTYTMYFTRMPALPARAHLYGGDIRQTGQLAKIEAVTNGELAITVDGYAYRSAPLNFSGQNTYDLIGHAVETGFNKNLETEAVVNASISPQTTTLTATINEGVLVVSGVGSGAVEIGGYVCLTSNPCYGPGLPNAPESPDFVGLVTGFLGWEGGTNGGIGAYSLFIRHSDITTPTKMVETYGLMTVNSIISGTMAANLAVRGAGVNGHTAVEEAGSRTGTWIVDQSQTVASEKMTLLEPPLAMTWNPITGVTRNSGYYILQAFQNFNWKNSTISYLSDVPGHTPVASLIGMTRGFTGVNGIPNTNSYADSPGSMVTNPTTWMNSFYNAHGYIAGTFQLTYNPTGAAPANLMSGLQTWGSGTGGQMVYLQSCSQTTNSIVNGGACN